MGLIPLTCNAESPTQLAKQNTPSSAEGIKSLLGVSTEASDAPVNAKQQASVESSVVPALLSTETDQSNRDVSQGSTARTAKQRKAENASRVHAELETAKSELAAAVSLLAEVKSEVVAKESLVGTLSFTLGELTKMSEAEAQQEYFASQKAEREARAAAYQSALSAGRITPNGVPVQTGYAPAPCDAAIAARIIASRQGYVRRAPGQ